MGLRAARPRGGNLRDAFPQRLVLHVSRHAIHRDILHALTLAQLHIHEHARIHSGREHRPLLVGGGRKQLLPRPNRVHCDRSRRSSPGARVYIYFSPRYMLHASN